MIDQRPMPIERGEQAFQQRRNPLGAAQFFAEQPRMVETIAHLPQIAWRSASGDNPPQSAANIGKRL